MVRVSVVVLGDVGRSPRMQYHAVSLANAGADVDLVGYSGSRPHRLVMENEKISLRHLAEPPSVGSTLAALALVFKCIWQAVTLFWCLMVNTPKMDVILLQNPPGLPALLICWMVARLRGARFLVDWHNYTWSILALRWNKDHPVVRLVRWYEYTVGGWADDGFCVTEAMKKDLRQENPKIVVRTFYDRPLKNVFRPVTLQERHHMMKRMEEINPDVFGSNGDQSTDATKFTESSEDGIQLRKGRPVLLISSTSWTADEDFGVLFDALSIYDQQSRSNSALPGIVLVVTGKGPLKEYYLSQLPEWDRIELCAPWLAAEDYPLLMGSTDLGVCLHASSSGLDLPMKAVDMLGCRVPVLALNYPCIEELVKPNRNGLLFVDPQSLAGYMVKLLEGFGSETKCELDQLKTRLEAERAKNEDEWDWESNWKKVVGPVVV